MSAVYFARFHKRNIAVALIIFAVCVFSIVFFVSFEDNIGLGIGLLGILSLIRLRTNIGNLTDISFLFYSITLGLLTASLVHDLTTVIIVNVILSVMVLIVTSEKVIPKKFAKMKITFDEVIIDPSHTTERIEQKIKDKYGITPIRVNPLQIDYLKDSCVLEITYEIGS